MYIVPHIMEARRCYDRTNRPLPISWPEAESGDPIRFALTLDSGDWRAVFACHGNGTVGKDFEIAR